VVVNKNEIQDSIDQGWVLKDWDMELKSDIAKRVQVLNGLRSGV
jgi:hypothetical protein